jgi:hypothetical protein
MRGSGARTEAAGKASDLALRHLPDMGTSEKACTAAIRVDSASAHSRPLAEGSTERRPSRERRDITGHRSRTQARASVSPQPAEALIRPSTRTRRATCMAEIRY